LRPSTSGIDREKIFEKHAGFAFGLQALSTFIAVMEMPMRLMAGCLFVACLCVMALAPANAQGSVQADLEKFVSQAVAPVMKQHGIPGMQIGIIADGQSFTFEYGVASRKTGKPVTPDTLFEIGSISKAFNVTLAAYGDVTGKLSLSEGVGAYVPALRDSPIGKIPLFDLATHTAGGFPLQLPDGIDTRDQLIAYYRNWKPAYPPETMRTYANPSIGLLGVVTAAAMHGDYAALMESRVFRPLGLDRTFLKVPESEMPDYAQGYTRKDAPVRMSPAILALEAYGVRTTAGDLLRFLGANMGLRKSDDDVQRAIDLTHTGYYRLGPMTQALLWEQYSDPAKLADVVETSLPRRALEPSPVVAITPPEAPRPDVFINKTGSTSGFAAYVAFRPDQGIGVVLLANKFYPNEARVKLAWALLGQLRK